MLRLVLVLVCLVCVACGGGAPAQRAATDAGTASPESTRLFPVLARTWTPSDALPSSARAVLKGGLGTPDRYGIQLGLARHAAGAPMWIVPARNGICVFYEAGKAASGGCAPLDLARTGLATQAVGGAAYGLSGRRLLYGLVPAGVRSVELSLPGRPPFDVAVRDSVWHIVVPDRPGGVLRVGDRTTQLT